MRAIPVSEVKIVQTYLSQERSRMMLSSKLLTRSLYKSPSPWCWFYLRVDYPLTDENLCGRAQGLLFLMVSQGICLQTWWLFLGAVCVHPCMAKENNTLVMWAHLELWINMPSAVTQARLCRHICNQHVHCSCHLWSSALKRKNIPESDSHTLTDRSQTHTYSQCVLTKCFPLTGQFVWYRLLFIYMGLDLSHLYCVTLQIDFV